MPSSALRFAINLGNALLAEQSADGELRGLTVDLARKIAHSCQFQERLKPYPAAKLIVDDAVNNQWDIAFLAVDPARENELRFTSPYLTIDCTVLVRRDSEVYSVQEMDREGMTINVGRGSAYSLPLTRTLKHARLCEYPTTQQALSAFLAGEGDMVANIRQLLKAAAQGQDSVRVLPESYSQIQQAICVPRVAPRYYERMETLVRQWRQDGTLAALIARHIYA
ncbi:MAG: transporter substrate-binding domain-containing protein [Klebsiella grimontii]|uniref:transporter substrate-binding domain-containing protein n=1 Tax=Klebsiella grimontii TaxID=2058152 RepID=UPI0029027A99|nr:transporter substrate-binding domain-containing protein [Klebsiella grimontii]MDU1520388.1 transporter substrate-binding domain-containing protein [Klebsiella michiganensis]MDU1618768.1 transporter substrate-binding domain-containing protein [Klebsiella michiganensis]MDU7348214.1 transporter substrate-binding domain-containing protein [Klebsiella grimontii]